MPTPSLPTKQTQPRPGTVRTLQWGPKKALPGTEACPALVLCPSPREGLRGHGAGGWRDSRLLSGVWDVTLHLPTATAPSEGSKQSRENQHLPEKLQCSFSHKCREKATWGRTFPSLSNNPPLSRGTDLLEEQKCSSDGPKILRLEKAVSA